VKQQIVDMAMNASGIRDTARVLHVSPTTVINEFMRFWLASIPSKWKWNCSAQMSWRYDVG
jgi:transposase-like protein